MQYLCCVLCWPEEIDISPAKMPRQNLPTWRRYLTVEPAIFFYAYGLMMSMPIWRQYVYSVISEMKGFPYEQLMLDKEGPGCQEHFAGPNITLKDLEKEVGLLLKLTLNYRMLEFC